MKKFSFSESIFWPIFFMLVLLIIVISPVIIFNLEIGNENVIENRGKWKVYTNEEFGFMFEYPPSWRVVDFSDDGIVPTFHVFPPEVQIDDVDVITPHTNKPNVSIYPEGYPTEGFVGHSVVSSISFKEVVEESVDFYLANEEDWATMIIFEKVSANWNDKGFLWARASVDDYKVFCFDDKEEIIRDLCDPMLGHKVIHEGLVDRKERVIQKEILESFNFIK